MCAPRWVYPALGLALLLHGNIVEDAAASPPGLIDTLPQLVDAILLDGGRVGFLSEGNFHSVQHLLPDTVSNGGKLEVVIMAHSEDLEEGVVNETLLAGLVSGEPSNDDGILVPFSSRAISPRAMLMPPPCAENDEESSADLALAVNAAWARIVSSGQFLQAHEENKPFESVASFTCAPVPENMPFPSEPKGTLAEVVRTGVLKVSALGPSDWGVDGNYTANPPTGFWPRYLEMLVAEMSKGLNKDINIERVWGESSTVVLGRLQDGTAHVSEPYYVTGAFYEGKARSSLFTMSCTMLGYDSTFFTLNHELVAARSAASTRAEESGGDGDGALGTGAVVGIAAAAAAAVLLGGTLVYVISQEKKGSPLFTPLNIDTQNAI